MTDPTPSPSPTPPERIAPLTAEECHILRLRLPPPFADGTRDRFTVIAEKVYAMELEAIAREAKLNSSSSESVPKISAGVSGEEREGVSLTDVLNEFEYVCREAPDEAARLGSRKAVEQFVAAQIGRARREGFRKAERMYFND